MILVLAEMVRVDFELDPIHRIALWTSIALVSAVVVFVCRRSRYPARFLIAGAAAMVVAFLLLQMAPLRILPLPSGPPGRVVVVTDPLAKCLYLASVFFLVTGLVTFLASFIWFLRSRRSHAASPGL